MLTSKVLCDRLNDLHRDAQASDEYYAAFVYSTAEDLADGMLKGKGVEAVDHLLGAYERNRARTASTEEQAAWTQAQVVAREVYGLPAGYLPDEAS